MGPHLSCHHVGHKEWGRLGEVEPSSLVTYWSLKVGGTVGRFGVLVEYRNIEHNIIKLRRVIIYYFGLVHSLGLVYTNRLQNIILQFCHNQLVSNNC